MSKLQVPATHDDELPLAGVLPSPPLDSMPALLRWYSKYLCNAELRDPRGFRVCFEPNAFVHLAKITDKYGREPKNKQLAIGQMERGRFPLIHGKTPNYDPEHVRNLAFATAFIQKPDFIVENWQAQGSAYPGEVYVRDFGTSGRRKYRVLICKVNGLKRVPVTAFAKPSPRTWRVSQDYGLNLRDQATVKALYLSLAWLTEPIKRRGPQGARSHQCSSLVLGYNGNGYPQVHIS